MCATFLSPFKVHRHTRDSWNRQPEAAVAGSSTVFTIDGFLLCLRDASNRQTIGRRCRSHFETAKRPSASSAAHIRLIEFSGASRLHLSRGLRPLNYRLCMPQLRCTRFHSRRTVRKICLLDQIEPRREKPYSHMTALIKPMVRTVLSRSAG